MTGEITLRGRVLPIGGLKEKLLAAKIGNIKTVLIPKGNVPDMKKIPKEITKGMRDHPGGACRSGPATGLGARESGGVPRCAKASARWHPAEMATPPTRKVDAEAPKVHGCRVQH